MDEFESHLVATLTDQAAKAEVPPVDPTALLMTGQREVRRRRSRALRAGVAAAAAVALVAVGTTLGVRWAADSGAPVPTVGPTTHEPPSPAKTTPTPEGPLRLVQLPHGAPPSVPYWAEGSLHVGARSIAMLEPRELVGSDGTVLVLPMHPKGAVDLLTSTGLRRLTGSGWEASISSDGRYAAWEVPDADWITVALWDLDARKEISRFRTPYKHSSCCGGGDVTDPLSVDNQGRVYFPLNGVSRWDFRTGRFSDVTGRQGVDRYVGSYRGVWSPDGRRVARIGQSGTPFVYDVKTRRTVKLALPEDVSLEQEVAVWETPTSVLIAVARDVRHRLPVDAPGAILRCDVTTGDCEVAARLARASNMTLPGPSWTF